jgi:hypothetical protein
MDLIVFGYFHLLPILSPIISIWWSPTPSCPGDRGHGGVIPKCHELSDWGRHLLRWFLLFGFTKSMEQLCCSWDWASGIGNHNITLGFPTVPPRTVLLCSIHVQYQNLCSLSRIFPITPYVPQGLKSSFDPAVMAQNYCRHHEIGCSNYDI